MLAFALALSLAGGPAPGAEDRLPGSLSEPFVPQTAPAEESHEVLVGVHLGAASGVDAASPSFLAGFEWRIHFLPWLGASGSVDFQTREPVAHQSGTDFFEIPFMWSLLLSPPLDLGAFRPYGAAGGGFTITNISGAAAFGSTDLNALYFLGFGVEFKLSSSVVLDLDARYVWANNPSGPTGFSTDWRQVTAGLLVTLPH